MPASGISLLLAAACALVLALVAVAPAAARQAKPSQPETNQAQRSQDQPGKLFVQSARRGSLRSPQGKRDRRGRRLYTLTLRGVAPQLVWFQDRPGRDSGHMSTRGFARSWAKFGFRADPPNAALSLLDGHHRANTVVVELTRPRYDRKRRTMRYRARLLSRATGGLAHLEGGRDRRVPRRFGVASLFIDDAQVVNGCTVEFKAANCTNLRLANLRGADLRGANLANVDLTGADLTGANLANANLSGAYLMAADLKLADLTGANLANAGLADADLRRATMNLTNVYGADLTGADLAGVDLVSTNLQETNLYGANLLRANLYPESVRFATFCRTTMPDGSVNNSGCS